MPLVPFESLGDESRVWVFAAEPALDDDSASALLSITDGFLAQWAAHGSPLTCGRELREGRFLVIGVDQNAADASGCSIDGLYRKLADFEKESGVSLLSRGNVYYRGEPDGVLSASREEFATLSSSGAIGPDTIVFDTSITSMGELRERFELPAGGSWHRALLAV
ncbi:MAG TPA: hypothetical protein VMY38_04180 [Gemmatimonadaceae bacterium]|nr:hypothetical protein [Gemmatimonadaceae bacterium]